MPNITNLILKTIALYFSVLQHPQLHVVCPFCPEHFPADGQPIHFTPFFLALHIYVSAIPTINNIIPITKTSAIYVTLSFYACKRYSALKSFSFLRISPTNITANAATAINPAAKPFPRAPVVASVPN